MLCSSLIISSESSEPSELQRSYLSVALSFTAWTDSWLDLQFKSKPKYLLHHDMVALKKWYNGNLTSSAKQCIFATACYPMCYDPFDWTSELVNNLNLDGSMMETTKPENTSWIWVAPKYSGSKLTHFDQKILDFQLIYPSLLPC